MICFPDLIAEKEIDPCARLVVAQDIMNLLKHPLFQINMILVCSLVFIELLHVNYHRTAPPCPVQQIEMEDDW